MVVTIDHPPIDLATTALNYREFVAMKLALCVLLCSIPFQVDAKTVTIPLRFHGEFNSSLKYCGTGLSDMRLRVSGTKIRFYESEGNVKSIFIQPNGEITIMAEYSGEGENWTNMIQLGLSQDGNKLIARNPSDAQTEQQSTIRLRCPKK